MKYKDIFKLYDEAVEKAKYDYDLARRSTDGIVVFDMEDSILIHINELNPDVDAKSIFLIGRNTERLNLDEEIELKLEEFNLNRS